MLDRLKTILSNNRSKFAPFGHDPEVEIDGKKIPLRIMRSPRAKQLSMRVDAVKREIRITIPAHASTNAALEFVRIKKEWIGARLDTAPDAAPIAPGSTLAVQGEAHLVSWHPNWSRQVMCLDGELRLGGPEPMVRARILRWLKSEARRIFTDEITHYCGIAGEQPLRLQLNDPRSRWGSCSSRGTIALSWRLIMAPSFVRRSVIAHEVAHIRHMNHSPQFYAWLDSIYEGDRKAADRWLKMHGTGLQTVGR